MGNNVEGILNEILKSYKSIATKAIKGAARKGQKDIIKEAERYLQLYYDSYDPHYYNRTYSLQHALTPIFNNNSTSKNIVVEFGIEYNPGALEGKYKGGISSEQILDNFLVGNHGGAQQDFNSTYTLMPNFFDNELPRRLEAYIQGALVGAVMNRLKKL